ncbi:MAG: mannosyltransferase family protein [Archangium sp.]
MPRSASRTVALVALGALLTCTVLVTVAARAFPESYSPARASWPSAHLLLGWARFDAGWYAHIATRGYSYTPGQQCPVAYFPAYPLAIRGLGQLGVDPFIAGVLLSVLCGLAAVMLFTRWASLLRGEEAARDAGLLLVFYPFAFYLYGAMYSDALFLLLVVGAFYLLERGQLLPAVLVGALATAARPVAPALVLGLLVRRLEWKRQRGERWSLGDALPVLAALGFLAYILFLWHDFGEPFAFAKVQAAWGQQPGWRTWLKVRWFQGFSSSMTVGDGLRLVGHAAFTFGALALVWPTAKRLGWGYGAYVAAMAGMPALSTKDFMSMGRYLLASFPLFLTFALLLRERPRLRWRVLAASAVLLLSLAAAYGAGAYVA